jgi:hypothetical protein
MSKTLKAEILTTITSRYHGQIFHPAGEDQEPVVVEWPVDDSEDGQAWLKGMQALDEKGYIKIIQEEPAKKPTKAKLDSDTSEVKSNG